MSLTLNLEILTLDLGPETVNLEPLAANYKLETLNPELYNFRQARPWPEPEAQSRLDQVTPNLNTLCHLA
jgi:hypothetical protein